MSHIELMEGDKYGFIALPNVLLTPHVAIYGAPYRQQWEEILRENCRRFANNEPLLNVVDKAQWY